MKTRRDALPEHRDWTDRGCEVSPTCLGCPLAVCRYDHPNGVVGLRAEERRARTRELKEAGAAADEVAEALGCSLRTVFRLRREEVRDGRP